MRVFLSNYELTSSHSGSLLSAVWQLVLVILVLVFTLGLIYLCAYFARKFKLGNSVNSSSNINVLEYKNLGNNTNLVLVSVGTKYILLSNSKEKTNFICEVDKDEINLEKADNGDTISFSDTFASVFKKNNNDENGGD